MSNKTNKSPLEEAKFNYEQIQKFAEEQAAEQLKEQVAEKLKHLFEDITININGEEVDVQRDGESIASVSDSLEDGIEGKSDEDMGIQDMGLSTDETTIGDSGDTEEFFVSDEEDEIGLDENIEEIIQNENMEEMNQMTMEQEVTAPAPTAIDAPPVDAGIAPEVSPVTPVEEAPAMPELLSKLDTLINIMLQQQGGMPEEGGATAGTEQEFEVIDDEAAAAAPAPAAPVAAPIEEEIDIVDFEEPNHIDEMEEAMLEIIDTEEPTIEETRGLGFTSKRTGDKTFKMDAMEKAKGHHAPVTAIKESKINTIKAQHESKTDELIKENNSLKNMVKALQGKETEFEEAFVNLRTQFNEMQLFNGKLALVNKVLMNGGLTTDEKIKICEQFDSVQTFDEASKLFKSIIKENNIKIVGDVKEKLKGNSTNTAQPKSTSEPLYESKEAKRAKVLAGMIKIEDGE